MQLNLEKLKKKLDELASLPEAEKERLRKEMEDDTKCKFLAWERDVEADNIERQNLEHGRLL